MGSAGLKGGYGEKRGSENTRMTYDPWTDWSRGAAFDWMTQPGNIPGQWTGAGDMGSLDIPFTADAANRLMTLFNLDPTAAEMRGADEFKKATDVTGMLNRAKSYQQSIGAPQVRNALAATGGGRSGAEAEAQSRAATEMALPIEQMGHQAQKEYGQLLANLGNLAAARTLSATGAAGQLGLGMGGLQNQRDIAGAQINASQMNQMLGVLASLLRPLQTRGGRTFEQSGWDITGEGKANFGGIA